MADKTQISGTTVILIVIAVVLVVFLLAGCKLSCKSSKEGYKRSGLAGDCFGLQRTPVDYAMKYPHGWQRNPHYQTDPANEHQPLEFGPIDFYRDERALAAGKLYEQYNNNWGGCGKQLMYLSNDSKNRFDLTRVGDQGARVQLDDMYNTRFGKRGPSHTERSYDEPNPFFKPIYGGPKWLVRASKLGD